MHLLGFAFALLIGLSLGLLGAGGSILTVPVFAYVLGYPPKEAIAMSLAVVGATAAIGAAGQIRRGNVESRVALLFGVVAMGGAVLGSQIARFVPGAVQLLLLAAVMLPAAIFMARPARIAPERSRRRNFVLTIGIAAVVGTITGLAGIGGGFMIVPALVLLLGCPMQKAVGTSLVVIAMNSAAALVGYLGHTPVHWPTVVVFTLLAAAGILLAGQLAGRLSDNALRRTFAALLVAVALYIIYENRIVLASGEVAASPAGGRSKEPTMTYTASAIARERRNG